MRKRPYRRRALSSLGPAAELLSRREIDVLRLLAVGHSNNEIARCLVIAESTVKMHIKHLYAKLDVRNRVEATIQAQVLRLFP